MKPKDISEKKKGGYLKDKMNEGVSEKGSTVQYSHRVWGTHETSEAD
jgi:hypothetical protein